MPARECRIASYSASTLLDDGRGWRDAHSPDTGRPFEVSVDGRPGDFEATANRVVTPRNAVNSYRKSVSQPEPTGDVLVRIVSPGTNGGLGVGTFVEESAGGYY
jgi:hypothetical protein